MREKQPSIDDEKAQRKSISIQERSVHVGDFIVINAHGIKHAALKQRFAEGGYHCHETRHFLLFTRSAGPKTILAHWFDPITLQLDIQSFLTDELSSLGPFNELGVQSTLLNGILDSMKTQEIRMRERSVFVGEIAVMNGYGLNLRALKRHFEEEGYQVQETPHFLLCVRDKAPATLLIHRFTPDELHTNVSHHLVEEMRPFGCIPNNARLGEFMTGIMGTTLPGNIRRAWNFFGTNTLQRLLCFVITATPEFLPDYGTLEMSATLYQRVCELCVGERFLDAACNSGLFGLLLAERRPFVKEVVGVDIDGDVFRIAQEVAQTRNITTVRYLQADLLSPTVASLGSFDTITALHVLEHFTEANMYYLLNNLLQVTRYRLIFAVPYEETPTAAYDHLQCFTRAKLEAVGDWCIEHMDGAGRIWCEDITAGGLLLVERLP